MRRGVSLKCDMFVVAMANASANQSSTAGAALDRACGEKENVQMLWKLQSVM